MRGWTSISPTKTSCRPIPAPQSACSPASPPSPAARPAPQERRGLPPARRRASPRAHRAVWSARAALGCGAALAGALLAGGCGTSVTRYQDAQSDHLRNRPLVVVESLPQPPLPEARHRAIVDGVEERVLKLPYLGRGIPRREFLQLTEGNYTARSEYELYSDTLSAVGVSDRELARAVGAAVHADLLFHAQPYYMPCTYCADGDSAYLVGTFIEAATGKLLLRVDVRAHPAASDAAIGEAFIEMEQELADQVLGALTPRPHIERFRNLGRLHESPETAAAAGGAKAGE